MFNDLFEEMSKMFDDSFFTSTKYSVPSFPPLKVIKRDNKVTFRFALAGYEKEDLDISFGKDCLILSTTENYNKKKNAEFESIISEKSKAKILVNTFKDAKFSYKYFIPEDKFDFDKVNAEFKNGILAITVPAREKKLENKVKKVEIK
jgi:HSP20 family molecular chaperone IbpA